MGSIQRFSRSSLIINCGDSRYQSRRTCPPRSKLSLEGAGTRGDAGGGAPRYLATVKQAWRSCGPVTQ